MCCDEEVETYLYHEIVRYYSVAPVFLWFVRSHDDLADKGEVRNLFKYLHGDNYTAVTPTHQIAQLISKKYNRLRDYECVKVFDSYIDHHDESKSSYLSIKKFEALLTDMGEQVSRDQINQTFKWLAGDNSDKI